MANTGAGAIRRLGRYHLAEPLGGGPTGEVFRAKVYGVAGFERQFAVKRFHTQFVIDPDVAARVSTAARSYGSLEHPRIARLHEYGVAQGHTFTATELVVGLDLARLVGTTYGMGEPLVAGAAAAVITQAARAVGYAHGRGICHFGICPTNLICTPEGEVKVTDFGFLPPRLPSRPAEDPSLAARIPYLAPEQLVGESTSSATDVYQLGVVAHELFTGERCFSGTTPLDVAQAILSGPLAEPPLPPPLLKVLRRSVARSPFERYPDAGAFADAFDAAVRATPLPGGSRDIGGIVRAAMHRLAEMSEHQVSGALSFPVPAPPRARSQSPVAALTPSPRKTLIGVGAGEDTESRDADDDHPTLVRERDLGFININPETPPPSFGPAAVAAAGTTRFDEDRGSSNLGFDEATKAGPSLNRAETAKDDDDLELVLHSMSEIGIEEIPEAVPQPISHPMAPNFGGSLADDARAARERARSNPPLPPPIPTPAPVPHPARTTHSAAPPPPPPRPPAIAPPAPPSPPPPTAFSEVLPPPDDATPPPEVESIVVELPRPPQPQPSVQQLEPPVLIAEVSVREPNPRMRTPRWLIAALVIAIVGGGGFVLYDQVIAGKGKSDGTTASKPAPAAAIDAGSMPTPAAQPDAAAVASASADAAPVRAEGDAAAVAAAAADAAPAPDAATVARKQPDTPPAEGKLSVSSSPSGAKVYVGGAYKGETPLSIEATGDNHTLALIKPGYKLFTRKISGTGSVVATLQAVTPSGGPAGIKVRCKRKNRYYVFVDGEDAGQLCPTERLGVRVGPHVVEIYDPVTEARRSFRVLVKQTRNSLRVYVD